MPEVPAVPLLSAAEHVQLGGLSTAATLQQVAVEAQQSLAVRESFCEVVSGHLVFQLVLGLGVQDAARAQQGHPALGLHHEVGEGALGHLRVGKDHLDAFLGQMGDHGDFEGLLLLVDGGVVLVDPQEAELMVEHQELVELDVRQILIVFVRAHLVSPAIVLVLVGHPVDLLVVVPGEPFARTLHCFFLVGCVDVFDLMQVADGQLVYLQVGAIFGLLDVELEAGPLERVLGAAHQHEVVFVIEAQGDSGDQQWDGAVLDEHSAGSLLLTGLAARKLGGTVRLQVQLEHLEGGLRCQHAHSDHSVLLLYLVVAIHKP